MLSATGSADITDSSATTKKAVLALADWIPGWIELRRRMLRVPGVQLSIRVGGELLVNVALGSADDERGVPLTTPRPWRPPPA
jgi:D-alanyl-D-alanine carboxypeptidase